MEEKKKRTSVGSGRKKTTVEEKLSNITFDLEKIRKIAAFYGSTDVQLANILGIDQATLNRWKEDESFLQVLKNAKDEADTRVVESLYQRAIGYEHKEDVIMQYQGTPIVVPTIKHYAPDTIACIFWLKNRDKEHWRDKQEVEHSVTIQYAEAKESLILKLNHLSEVEQERNN